MVQTQSLNPDLSHEQSEYQPPRADPYLADLITGGELPLDEPIPEAAKAPPQPAVPPARVASRPATVPRPTHADFNRD